ncbi:MAG: acetyl-CoA carboxylase carboxyltransferase subunit alpha [Lachnospiraceae bacterium]|nr:acetyl-CoA carboxylase carboxyltransferase subunit alpha [Lachnospiraceae bacterium]
MIREIDERIRAIDTEIEELSAKTDDYAADVRVKELKNEKRKLLHQCDNLTPADKVYLARSIKRPKVDDYINALFDDFFVQRGDFLSKEDKSILGGIAMFHGMPVTVLGHRKGRNINENMEFNFGMPEPEGYRKALRLMKQAEKFGRPVITFIDTPGAYPGLEAEEHGQANAIAKNLAEMSSLKVPIIAIVTGEGSSGGALAIGVANSVYMLENAVYSVLSPEGFASILWKDSNRSAEACDLMKLTAQDLKHYNVIDGIIKEPLGGIQQNPNKVYREIDAVLNLELARYKKMSPNELAKNRYDKFRYMDAAIIDAAKKENA